MTFNNIYFYSFFLKMTWILLKFPNWSAREQRETDILLQHSSFPYRWFYYRAWEGHDIFMIAIKTDFQNLFTKRSGDKKYWKANLKTGQVQNLTEFGFTPFQHCRLYCGTLVLLSLTYSLVSHLFFPFLVLNLALST